MWLLSFLNESPKDTICSTLGFKGKMSMIKYVVLLTKRKRIQLIV